MQQREEVGHLSAEKGSRRKRVNGFEEWGGYMAAKKMKLNDQFENRKPVEIGNIETQTSHIFKGISIYVNGYTKPSAEELKRLMMLHGGKYHYYYSMTNTTHMVATNLPDSKVKSLKGRKIVLPEWITDSIKAGKLLPDTNYLLYTPEITDRQQRLQLTKSDNQNITDGLSKRTNFSGIMDASNSSNLSTARNATNQTIGNSSTLEFLSKPEIPQQTNRVSFPTNMIDTSPNSKLSGNNSLAIKAGDPGFISEFYNHSRLHHISTAGQELKLYVQQLASEQKGKPFLGRDLLKRQKSQYLQSGGAWEAGDRKIIMHLDMDCFFVSVGLKNHPELRGQPVAVTHSKGKQGKPQQGSNIEYEASHYSRRLNLIEQDLEGTDEEKGKPPKISKYSSDYGSLSEVASCSYEARKAGIKNGMFLGEAMRRCPNLKTIPYDFDGYSEVSKLLYDTVASYTLDIEAVSCDELYIDCTELLQDVKISPSEFAAVLRNEIHSKTGCTASAGIGGNMLLARLATKLAKPNGQYVLREDHVLEFMKKQIVKDLPGVGYSTSAKLTQLGIKTCCDLQSWPLVSLQQEFGPKTGQTLYEHCRGIDNKSVTLEKDRKSVSAEINYGIRFEQEHEIYAFINDLASEVQQRLKKIDRRGRSLTLKLRIRKEDAPMQTAKFMGHGVCDSICKSIVLKAATDDSGIIGQECCALARSLKIQPQDYRGLGIQMGKLEPSVKDSSVKTMEHFLSKKVEGSTINNDVTSVQVPIASSSSDAVEQLSGERQATNIGENIPTTNPPAPSVPLTQSAYYAQISDMDQNVLDALPEELRQEILAACSERQESPPKKATIKIGKPSHTGKRGRPFGAKSKKGKSARDSPQKTLRDYQTIPASDKSVSSSSKMAKSCSRASLGGATEIAEVRELVKEWVQSAEEPGKEDIDHFKNYLIQLVEEDLEKTDLILKQFHRLASSAGQYWKESYFLILSYVQQKMLQDFGYMLKANDSFD